MRALPWIILIAIILLSVVGCEMFKWKECKQVGHSTLYCVSQMGDKSGQ